MARILVIASYTPSLVKFRGDLLRELVGRGHEVVGCSPDPDEPSLQRLANLGVDHHSYRLQRTGLNPLADLTTVRDLRRLMVELRPDHVLSYTVKPVIYGSLAAAKQGVPNIHAMITGLGTAFAAESLRERAVAAYVRFMYRAALARCRTVFFQNPDDRAAFVDLDLVDDAKVVPIAGSGVNLRRFGAVAVPPPPPVFLLIARLVRDKGLAEFAAAARRVKERHPDARFQVAGFFEDHPRGISRAQMDRWVAEGAVEFTGFADDVRPLLQGCTVYCLPSYHEGTPRTVLEALATGRAVVTTDAPGCRETVTDGDNGFLVPVRDATALAAAMLRFCEDPGLAPAMGQRSRRLAEETFDVVKVNAAIMAGLGLGQSEA